MVTQTESKSQQEDEERSRGEEGWDGWEGFRRRRRKREESLVRECQDWGGGCLYEKGHSLSVGMGADRERTWGCRREATRLLNPRGVVIGLLPLRG